MKFNGKPKIHGFTLVELLVVIAIIAVLASVAFSLGPKMMTKAKGTESMSNLRQMGPLLTTYASEHNNKLPAIKGTATLPDGSEGELYWHEACLQLLFPNTALTEFKSYEWWKRNKNIFRNPLLKENAKPRGFSPTTPGYGMNEMIAENIATATTGAPAGHLEAIKESVPLAAIPDPARTPVVAPSDDFFYRYDDGQISTFQSGTMKELLIEGKAPVLFIDGHVEAILPKDYLLRRLDEVPMPSPIN